MSEPTPSLRESTLINEVMRGDTKALAELFALHRERLRRIIQFRLDSRLRGRIDEEDILQESYINAAKRIDKFVVEASQSCFVWLRGIVWQTLIDYHRAHIGTQKRNASLDRSIHRKKNTNSTTMSLSSHLMAQISSPSSMVMKAEFADLVDSAIESMSDLDQEVLALRHFEELTNRETAQVLNITEQAASLRYVRALARLKEVIVAIAGEYNE